jgi:aquaporin Z
MVTLSARVETQAVTAIRRHWPEYLMEAAELGTFMICACLVTALLYHPDSPVRGALPDQMVRRMFAGIAMGLTAVSIFYSRWGKRSGAHLNPSVTLTFFILGKIHAWDALFYVAAQFAGGIAGVLLATRLIGSRISHPAVNYAVTTPGPSGDWAAFAAELLISFLMMSTVLTVSNRKSIAHLTPLFAGTLVATFIFLEAPLSGMSMNPARTLGSAFPAMVWTSLWIYFTAPPIGMLLASRAYLMWYGAHRVFCAKLHHQNNERCIFRCNYRELN